MSERQGIQVPRALRRELSVDRLLSDKWCDSTSALGSYWSRSNDCDLQSQLVKCFKGSGSKPLQKTLLTAIARAYAAMIADAARCLRPSAVVRVLSSGETVPDPLRPHSILIRQISDALRAPDFTHMFFRTEPRKPMRVIDRFSGQEVLRQRIGYILQDLFIKPHHIGGTVVLIDDIYNLGATARVYAAALKTFAGVERVHSINIAAARFSGGKDGWGHLALDIDLFAELAGMNLTSVEADNAFEQVWIESGAAVFHLSKDCAKLAHQAYISLRFLAHQERVPCPACASVSSKTTIRQWMRDQFAR